MRNSKPHHQLKNKKKNAELVPKKNQFQNQLAYEANIKETGQNKGGSYWIYGVHALSAALQNPKRKFKRLVHTGQKNKLELASSVDLPAWELLSPHDLNVLLPREAVHQGLAGLAAPLEEPEIEEICHRLAEQPDGLLLLLDQVTDPHNVGAIMRSAAAFGAAAVILTERHAAPQSGVLAKAASGALDAVPLCRVTNLARAMEIIKQSGFWCVGLAGEAEKELTDINLKGKIALIMGSEESGLRRLTRENSDFLARLPTQGPVDQLNVSNAAAIALYEVKRQLVK